MGETHDNIPPLADVASAQELSRVSADLERTRRYVMYAVAATLATVAFATGYILLRDDTPKTTPLADPYQITQNEQKETIKLDRRNGQFWILEDGVEVRQKVEYGESRSLLDDKVYSWEKTTDASKMTVRLKYSGRQAYCVWRIWPSDALKKRLATADDKRDFIRIEFYSRGGVRVLSVSGLWNFARWVQEGSEQVLELQEQANCTAPVFVDIETCRVWY